MKIVDTKDRKKGIVAAILFHIVLLLILAFTTIDQTIPPFPEEEIVMEMDFSGSESSGGAPQEVSESNNETSSEAEEVDTQDEESPVNVNPNKTTTSPNKTKTDNQETEESESQTPKNDFSNVFGNGNSGSGTGNENGDGKNGNGDGISGPGSSGSVGAMSGRDLLYQPKIDNPIQQEGNVRVKIWVDKTGKVVQVKVLKTDPKTTSTSQAHFDAAARAAKKFKFDPSSSGKDKEYGYIVIEFKNK